MSEGVARRRVLAILFGVASLGSGQNGPRTLSVSSVHPAEFPSLNFFQGYSSLAGECGVVPARIAGNQVIIGRSSLCALIREAYDVQPNQISGMPREFAQVRPENYFTVQLQAEGEAPLSRVDQRELLRQVLRERFHLETHWEKKKLPLFALTVSSGRHKLSDKPLENCDGPAISQAEAARRVRVLTSCRPAMSMFQLAEQLTLSFDGERQVVDRTGLSGEYAFILKWSSDDGGAYPAIFTAIQEQLGLKLVAEEGEVDALAIDRLSYPTEN